MKSTSKTAGPVGFGGFENDEFTYAATTSDPRRRVLEPHRLPRRFGRSVRRQP